MHNALDNRHTINALYLDFGKAFDTVPHYELLQKLWQIGKTDPLWKLFSNYLSNRSHFVCYNGCNSSILPVLSGVLQGSILGPLLFLIYVNGLPLSIRSASRFLFADDTKLLHTIKNDQDQQLFQDDIHQVESWCQQYKLYLNTDKCNILHFSREKYPSQRFVSYTLDGATITAASTQRYLGIIVNSDLSWTDHLNHVCLKTYRSLYLIRQTLSTSSPVSLKKRLYISLVHSHLSYRSQLWQPHLIRHHQR